MNDKRCDVCDKTIKGGGPYLEIQGKDKGKGQIAYASHIKCGYDKDITPAYEYQYQVNRLPILKRIVSGCSYLITKYKVVTKVDNNGNIFFKHLVNTDFKVYFKELHDATMALKGYNEREGK